MALLIHCRISAALMAALVFFSTFAAAADVGELHALLESDVSIREKQIACMQLAIVGTADSIPVLTPLLQDAKLAHSARTALEGIPDPAVDDALRDSLSKLEGNQLVGVINSIGVRRDVQAVEKLTEMLSSSDVQTSAAAAGALGQIAVPAAVTTLLERLAAGGDHSEATAIACLACGDMLIDDNQQARAVEVYDAVRQSDTPRHLRIAATWSAVRARGNDALSLITELLQGEDDAMFAVALQATRIPIAAPVTGALVDALSQRSPDRRALIITALGDLGDAAVLPEIIPSVNDESRVVQLAAIGALEQLGDSAVIDQLIDVASGGDAVVTRAARNALEGLSGKDVNSALAGKLSANSANELLVSIAGNRRITEAIPALWKAAESRQLNVRDAAVRALGETIGPDEIVKLIRMVVAAESEHDRKATVAALTKACMRTPDREATVKEVSAELSRASVEMRFVLYELLRVVGGKTALQQVVEGARDPRDASQDASTRALGKWLTPDVAPELLELAKSFRNRKYRIRSMRGYVRVIQQFGLPADERLEMARQAFKVAERSEEKILTLNALTRFAMLDSLVLATDHLNDPALRDTAAQVALQMVSPNYGMIDQIKDKKALRRAMQKITKSGASAGLIKQAEDVLAGVDR